MPIFSAISPVKDIPSPASQPSYEAKPNNNTVTSHRPTTPRVSKRDAFSTPSISDALSDEPAAASKKIPVSHTEAINDINPFNYEELYSVWKKFVETVEAPQLKSALSGKVPVLREEWLIEYELDNELQNQRITLELKPQLLGYLRRNLKNERIEIEFTISLHTDQHSAIPYTDAEKWKALVERYPALINLKNRFGLDFE